MRIEFTSQLVSGAPLRVL